MSGRVESISKPRPHSFIEEWYELGDESHFWFQWRFAAARQFLKSARLPLDEPLRALEVGCGTGVLRTQFERETNWTVDATDLNYGALSKVTPGRGRVMYYDVTEQIKEFREVYDVAILFDVLEHVRDPIHFLQAIAAHLKPNGVLIVNVPALPSMFGKYDEAAGHLRRYKKSTLHFTLSESRFRVMALCYWGMALVPVLLARKWWHKLARKQSEAQVIRSGFHSAPAMNGWLQRVGRIETSLLSCPPAGSSLLALARKT